MSNHDPADAGLIDLSRYHVADLGAENGESALGHAVRRILTAVADEESTHHGFANTI